MALSTDCVNPYYDQEKFLGALQAVSGIVERRHTLPILANVLLRKNGPQIEFTTSDLEIQVRTTQELGGDDGTFSTTVGARKLIDILRSLPSEQVVSLSAAQNKLTLQAGKSYDVAAGVKIRFTRTHFVVEHS